MQHCLIYLQCDYVIPLLPNPTHGVLQVESTASLSLFSLHLFSACGNNISENPFLHLWLYWATGGFDAFRSEMLRKIRFCPESFHPHCLDLFLLLWKYSQTVSSHKSFQREWALFPPAEENESSRHHSLGLLYISMHESLASKWKISQTAGDRNTHDAVCGLPPFHGIHLPLSKIKCSFKVSTAFYIKCSST